MNDIYCLKINLNDPYLTDNEAYRVFKDFISKLMKIEKCLRYHRESDEFDTILHPSQKMTVCKTYITCQHLIMILSNKYDTLANVTTASIVDSDVVVNAYMCINTIVNFHDTMPASFEFFNIGRADMADLLKAMFTLQKLIFHHVPFYNDLSYVQTTTKCYV